MRSEPFCHLRIMVYKYTTAYPHQLIHIQVMCGSQPDFTCIWSLWLGQPAMKKQQTPHSSKYQFGAMIPHYRKLFLRVRLSRLGFNFRVSGLCRILVWGNGFGFHFRVSGIGFRVANQVTKIGLAGRKRTRTEKGSGRVELPSLKLEHGSLNGGTAYTTGRVDGRLQSWVPRRK